MEGNVMKMLHWDREDIYLSCCLLSGTVWGGGEMQIFEVEYKAFEASA